MLASRALLPILRVVPPPPGRIFISVESLLVPNRLAMSRKCVCALGQLMARLFEDQAFLGKKLVSPDPIPDFNPIMDCAAQSRRTAMAMDPAEQA